MFKDWDGKTPYAKVPTFYEDMDDFSADVLEKLDAEIQNIKKKILELYPEYDLSYVIPMRERIGK